MAVVKGASELRLDKSSGHEFLSYQLYTNIHALQQMPLTVLGSNTADHLFVTIDVVMADVDPEGINKHYYDFDFVTKKPRVNVEGILTGRNPRYRTSH